MVLPLLHCVPCHRSWHGPVSYTHLLTYAGFIAKCERLLELSGTKGLSQRFLFWIAPLIFGLYHSFYFASAGTSLIEKLILPILSFPRHTTVTLSPKVRTSSTWLILDVYKRQPLSRLIPSLQIQNLWHSLRLPEYFVRFPL